MTATGRRASWLTSSMIAMTSQFATIDEPPWLMNGVVRPVSGSRRVTPPMIANTWRANTSDRPADSSLPNGSFELSAVRRPRATMSPYTRITAIRPTRPSSSPIAAVMKSLLARG